MTDKEIQSSKKLKSVKSFLPFLKPYKKQLLVAAISLVLAASATLVVPLCFRKIVDLGFSDISHAQINLTFINLFLAAFVLAFASALRYYIVSWLGERVTSDIRKAVYSHIIVQSPEFFETKQSGELLSRINNDTSIVQILVGTSVSMAVRNLFLLAGGMTMMFITSIKLSLIILVTLLLTVLPIMLMGKKVRLLSRNSQDKIALASAIAGEKINAIHLPVSQVTSICFGGENMDEMYITSARVGLTYEQLAEEPLAGSSFIIEHSGYKGSGFAPFNITQH